MPQHRYVKAAGMDADTEHFAQLEGACLHSDLIQQVAAGLVTPIFCTSLLDDSYKLVTQLPIFQGLPASDKITISFKEK